MFKTIVVGVDGREGGCDALSRRRRSDAPRRAVRGRRRAARLASREWGPVGKVGVGLDGSLESRQALALALRIARSAGAEVLVRSVIDPAVADPEAPPATSAGSSRRGRPRAGTSGRPSTGRRPRRPARWWPARRSRP
jgi:nucleotide-binding universal stress UspA family protein